MAGLVSESRLEDGLTHEEKIRALVCAAEVEQVLKKHGCKMVASPIIAGDRVYAETVILPNQDRRI